MKLATYYRAEENTFCRLIGLEEQELNGYDKIYFFSEKETQIQVPSHFLRASNIIYGGTAFTNGIYQPFQQEMIDYTLPKLTIYKDYLKQCYHDGIKADIISRILDDSYYRQYAGKNKLPLPPILPGKRLWIYDMDFFQNGWQEWVETAAERKCRVINTIHPIICNNLSQYFEMRNMNKIARTNKIILDINVPVEEIPYLFKEYKNLFLADITKNNFVYLKIGGTFKTNFQYYKDLIYKLNLLYYFWSYNIPIKIKYYEPHIGANCNIINLLQAIDKWARGTNKKVSINDRIKKKPAYEEEKLLLKFYPFAADLFKQNYDDLSKRGFWKL